MPNATGAVRVRYTNGRQSEISVRDKMGRFTPNTSITSVEDRTDPQNILTWDILTPPGQHYVNSHKLRAAINGKKRGFGGPDSGDLTITLSDGTPVDTVPVDYIDDLP
jgi:hypothetical protein